MTRTCKAAPAPVIASIVPKASPAPRVGRLFDYARVSTADQDLAIQEAALWAAGCAIKRAEKRSSTTTNDRTELEILIAFADRGYTSHTPRQHIWDMGAQPAIPTLRHEAPVACPNWIYNNRNWVERFWARIKEWRAVASRYEKTAVSFLGVLCLAAALDWIRR